jgi:hypothetical protein
MNYRPLFVFGLARSGTNLLARLLDRHPSVAVALDPFMPLFRSLRNAVVAAQAPEALRQRFDPASPFQDYYFDPDGRPLLDIMLGASPNLLLDGKKLDALRAKAAARAALESPEYGVRMGELNGSDYGQLLKCAFDIIASLKPGASWVGCKEVWIIDFLPLLVKIFPTARFYIIERDPRAIVASLITMAGKDPTQAAHVPSYLRHWRKNVVLARRFKSDPKLQDRLTLISYEKLVAESESEMVKICEELEIEYTPTMLELSADGWKGNSSYDHGEQNIYTNTVERWREVLTDPIIQTVDYLCGPEMMLTNYRPVTDPQPEVVLNYLGEANHNPGSWRSDSGDAFTDFGGELLRHVLLQMKSLPDEQMTRRCFLFVDAFAEMRRIQDDNRQA